MWHTNEQLVVGGKNNLVSRMTSANNNGTHVRLHSTGGIVIWTNELEQQDMHSFLQNQIILVRGRKSVGLSKYGSNGEKIDFDPASEGFHGYSFPKGHIEANESEIDATYREIWEEAGLTSENLELVNKIGFLVKSDRVNREVHLYLFGFKKNADHVTQPPLTPILTDEIMEARWCRMQDIVDGRVKVKKELLSFFRDNLEQIQKEWNKFVST
jgi:8-oxo-dGTP pyrophosphatase MutT (NUDIX family)